eukprot:UC4_evm1s169
MEKGTVVLEDLTRLEYKAGILSKVKTHARLFDKIKLWYESKARYLGSEEKVESSVSAKFQIQLLEQFEVDKSNMFELQIGDLKSIGAQISLAKFDERYSFWQYEKPEDLLALEKKCDMMSDNLSRLAKTKSLRLQDHLNRELFSEKWHLKVKAHEEAKENIVVWCKIKKDLLETKETITGVKEARHQLSILETQTTEIEDMIHSSVQSLKDLGEEIRSARYETPSNQRWNGGAGKSQWIFENPIHLKERESAIDCLFVELKRL